jgi:hypothetical protein
MNARFHQNKMKYKKCFKIVRKKMRLNVKMVKKYFNRLSKNLEKAIALTHLIMRTSEGQTPKYFQMYSKIKFWRKIVRILMIPTIKACNSLKSD